MKKLFIYQLLMFFVAVLMTVPGSMPAVNAATPAEPTAFTIEQVLGAPFPSSLSAAHAGSRVAWVMNNRGAYNAWIAEPGSTGFNSRQLTGFRQDDGEELEICGFSHDDSSLIFVKGSRFNAAHNPRDIPHYIIYRVNCTTGKMEEIVHVDSGNIVKSPTTDDIAVVKEGNLCIVSPPPAQQQEPAKLVSVRGELSKPCWSPDGKKLLMSCARGKFPHKYSLIVLYDLEKNQLTYMDASIYMDIKPCWSPDGQKIAFIRQLTHGQQGLIHARTFPVPDPWEIRVASIPAAGLPVTNGNTSSTAVWRSPDTDTIDRANIAWLDTDHLVFTSEADGWCHLYTVPAKGENNTAYQVTKGKFEVEHFITVPELSQVFFTSNAEDINRRHIWCAGRQGTPQAVTDSPAAAQCIEWNPVITADHKYVAFFASSAVDPVRVFIRSLAADGKNWKGQGKPYQLAKESMPTDFPRSLVHPREVVFQSIDGWQIHGQLFLPPAHFKGQRPALMFFHGGPIRQMLPAFHYSLYYNHCYGMNQYLASRGYVVLVVNYRLGIGYGRAFREVADGGPRGCSEYRDLLAGAQYLRGLDNVDVRRIGLWGGSYGGLMTALGLARNSDLFAAGVDIHGVHDWNQWQAWSDSRPDDNDRMTWKSSPIADVNNWRAPVLLVHGDDDRNVPFSETVWLGQRLRRQGVHCELLILPGEVHDFLLHRSWVQVFSAAASFFDRQL